MSIHFQNLVSAVSTGVFFTAFFVKADGTFRAMNCRRGVKIGVKGTAPHDRQQEDRQNNVLTVYDVKAKGFRRINLSSLIGLNLQGNSYLYANEKLNQISKKCTAQDFERVYQARYCS